MTFAEMEIKVIMSQLLRHLSFRPTEAQIGRGAAARQTITTRPAEGVEVFVAARR
jgi:cytochrome P450